MAGALASFFLGMLSSSGGGPSSGLSMSPATGQVASNPDNVKKVDPVDRLAGILTQDMARLSSIKTAYSNAIVNRQLERVQFDDHDRALRAIDKNVRLVDDKIKVVDATVRNNGSILDYNRKLLETTTSTLIDMRTRQSYDRFADIENKLEASVKPVIPDIKRDDIERIVDDRIREKGLAGGTGSGGGGINPAVIAAEGAAVGAGATALGAGGAAALGSAAMIGVGFAAALTALGISAWAGNEVVRRPDVQEFLKKSGVGLTGIVRGNINDFMPKPKIVPYKNSPEAPKDPREALYSRMVDRGGHMSWNDYNKPYEEYVTQPTYDGGFVVDPKAGRYDTPNDKKFIPLVDTSQKPADDTVPWSREYVTQPPPDGKDPKFGKYPPNPGFESLPNTLLKSHQPTMEQLKAEPRQPKFPPKQGYEKLPDYLLKSHQPTMEQLKAEPRQPKFPPAPGFETLPMPWTAHAAQTKAPDYSISNEWVTSIKKHLTPPWMKWNELSKYAKRTTVAEDLAAANAETSSLDEQIAKKHEELAAQYEKLKKDLEEKRKKDQEFSSGMLTKTSYDIPIGPSSLADKKYKENIDNVEASKDSKKGTMIAEVERFDLSARRIKLSGMDMIESYSDDMYYVYAKQNLVLQAPNIMLLGKVTHIDGGATTGTSTPQMLKTSYEMPGSTPGAMLGGGLPEITSSQGPNMSFGPGATSVSPYSGSGGGGGGGGGAGGVSVPNADGGSDRAQEAFKYFKSQGWTDEQAAGIVGNLMQESGLNPHGPAGDGGLAVGIAQWHPDRQARFAQIFGHTVQQGTYQEQLAFVQWELTHTHKSAGAALKQAKTFEEATATVSSKYEVAGTPMMGNRIANASSVLQAAKTAANESWQDVFGVKKSSSTSSAAGFGDQSKGIVKGPTGADLTDPKQVPISGGSAGSRSFGGNRGRGKLHTGVDIPATPGTPIRATMDGGIIRRMDGSDVGGYGYVIDVEYPDGTVQRYAHLGTSAGGPGKAFASGLKVGSSVKAGDIIGFSGYSGNAGPDFPHVHYEVIKKSYYDANHGRPSGRATDKDELLAGREDPRQYWSDIQKSEIAALKKSTVDPSIDLAKKPELPKKTWQREVIEALSEDAPKKATPAPTTPPQTRQAPTRGLPNTHDGINMSPSSLPDYAASITA